MDPTNPLVDDVSLVNEALDLHSVEANYPGANKAFQRIIDAMRRVNLYRYPGDPAPEQPTQSKRKSKRGKRHASAK